MAKASGGTRLKAPSLGVDKFLLRNMSQRQSSVGYQTIFEARNDRFLLSATIDYDHYSHTAELKVKLKEGSAGRDFLLDSKEIKGETGDATLYNGKVVSGAESKAINDVKNNMSSYIKEANSKIKEWYKHDFDRLKKISEQLKTSLEKGWIDKETYNYSLNKKKKDLSW